MTWRVILYESKGGQKPIEDFIQSLQPSTIAKLRNQLNLLAEFGPKLAMPNAKPIGSSLYELRVRGKEEVRILYILIKKILIKKNDVYLLHGFKKKAMRIRNRDLKIAMERKNEIINNL